MVRDVVCGMEFSEEEARTLGAERVEREGRTFWFCSPFCKKEFEKNPERFLKKEASRRDRR